MSLLTLLDDLGILRLGGFFELKIVDSALGFTVRDANGNIVQHPPEVLHSRNGESRVRKDKLIRLMMEKDEPEMIKDDEIEKIARQYFRKVLYFRGRETRVDYTEYPEPVKTSYR